MNEDPSYFSILTADVRYDERLKANEKIMYSEITALSNKNGYCSASNTYFAKLYKVHKDTISDWINNLKKYGYIKIVLERKDGTKQINKRKIYINNSYIDRNLDPIGENTYTLSVKSPIPYRQNHLDPIGEITEENNTRINNTRCNNHDESTRKQTIISVWNSLDDNIPKIKTLNASTDRYKMLKARMNEHGLDKVIEAIKSISNSKFLQGYKTNFVITFDRFVRPNNFIKVIEGNYADKKNQGTKQEQEDRSNYQSALSESELRKFEELKKEIGL